MVCPPELLRLAEIDLGLMPSLPVQKVPLSSGVITLSFLMAMFSNRNDPRRLEGLQIRVLIPVLPDDFRK